MIARPRGIQSTDSGRLGAHMMTMHHLSLTVVSSSRWMLAVFCVLVSAGPAAAAGTGARVGQFLDVTERVSIRRGARTVKAFLLSGVLADDVIRVPRRGQAEVVLDRQARRVFLLGGSVCRAEADRIITLNGTAPREKRRLTGAFRLPRSGRGFAGSIQRGAESAPTAPPDPIGGTRTQPGTLSWAGVAPDALPGDEVEVEIREGEGEMATSGRLVFHRRVPASERQVPLPERTLEPGTSYVWIVRRVADGVPTVRVLVLPLRLLLPEELEGLRELEAAPRVSRADWLALAVAYERFTLLKDALETFREAAKRGPPNPDLARQIRRLERACLGLPPLPPDRPRD